MSGRRSRNRIERGKEKGSGSGVKWMRRNKGKKVINDKRKENGSKKRRIERKRSVEKRIMN